MTFVELLSRYIIVLRVIGAVGLYDEASDWVERQQALEDKFQALPSHMEMKRMIAGLPASG